MLYAILLCKEPDDVQALSIEADNITIACELARTKAGPGWEVTDAHKREMGGGVPQDILK